MIKFDIKQKIITSTNVQSEEMRSHGNPDTQASRAQEGDRRPACPLHAEQPFLYQANTHVIPRYMNKITTTTSMRGECKRYDSRRQSGQTPPFRDS